MSTAVLASFFLAFLVMFGYAIRFPALAIPLGIMTYAYKQISSLAVPMFQVRGAVFNYLMAAMIAIVYMYNLIVRNPGVNCRTKEGKTLQILIWAFLLFFWVYEACSLWDSPWWTAWIALGPT